MRSARSLGRRLLGLEKEANTIRSKRLVPHPKELCRSNTEVRVEALIRLDWRSGESLASALFRLGSESMNHGLNRQLLLLLCTFYLVPTRPPLLAQTALATLQGRITDHSTAEPVAGALVLYRNLQTDVMGYRYTNELGYYYFPALPPGSYQVRVDVRGYQPKEWASLELAVASQTELNLELDPVAPAPGSQPPASRRELRARPSEILAIMYGADAAIPSAVLIRIPAPLTETLTGTISSLIDRNKIQELPLAGRDVYTLLVLQPDVSSDNATARGLGFSVNGQRVASSNFLLDGVDNNDLTVTGPATRVSADAVKEFRMNTNNYSAEFGRAAGFIANSITQSGSNQLHGTVFEYFNHAAMNASSFRDNWQGFEKEPFHQHQYGVSLGGPVRRDRLFGFGNLEQLRSSSQSQPREILLPSPEAVAAAPSGSLAAELLQRFPPPNGDPIPGDANRTNYSYRQPVEQRNTYAMGRIDLATASGRQRYVARYALSHETTDDFSFSPYPNLSAPLTVQGQNFVASYVQEHSAVTNELKFAWTRNRVQVERPQSDVPTLGIPGVALPGSAALYDYDFRDTVGQMIDNYSQLLGRHAIIAGFEWRPRWHDSLLSLLRDGQFTFPSVSDFIADRPSSLLISLDRFTGMPPADADFRREYFNNEAALFLQDNLKLTHRLTLNLGLRWEYFGAPSPRNGTRDYNFVFGSGATVMERIANGSVQEAELFRPDNNNFAPRFGFALDLLGNGRGVLRGGYGIFFDRIFDNFWMDASTNQLVLQSFFNVNGSPPQFEYTLPARNGVLPGSAALPSSTVAVDQGLRTPYSQNWFIGWQQQLDSNTVLEVNHTGSVGRKLATTDRINRARTLPVTIDNRQGRLNPAQPDISFRSNQGVSDRVALQASLNHRWNRGLQFQVSYTYSRTRDVQSDPLRGQSQQSQEPSSILGDTSFFQSRSFFTLQFNPYSDYGLSDFDQTQNLIFNFVAQTPLLAGIPRAFAGWQVAAIAGFRSGFPFSVVSSGAFQIPGSGLVEQVRSDFLGVSSADAFLNHRTPIPGGVVLLDASKFAKPPSNRSGDSQRNQFRGPGFWNVDFSLSRQFSLKSLGSGVRLQLRAELFNLFNHVNLNNPASVLGAADFGSALFGRLGLGTSLPSLSPLDEQPRRIQVVARFSF
jgi:Carboxypeptidase regulatory-like domain/TonB dependent receptor-like, beta-barrel